MRVLAVIGAITFATSCVLDLDGLSGGPRAGVDAGPDGDANAPPVDAGRAETDAGTGCPGTDGPTAVRVSTGGASFCIDATEVTNVQYARFLASSPRTDQQLAACATNGSFVPNAGWPGDPSMAVVNVDWCDAYAFCAWAGKRLCGKIGGDHLPVASRNDAAQSQWYFACSANGTRAYPYGASFDANACVTGGGRAPAGSKATCEGGFPGVLDLSGGVEEWTDECTESFSDCVARGGTFSDAKGFECTTEDTHLQPRMLAEAWRGFRCCSP